MKTLGKDKVIYSFKPENEHVYFVEDGETFWVETDDCYSGQIVSEDVLRPNIDISIMDASVGPINISNAEVGDTLCVQVIDIQFADYGVMVTSPGLGVLGDKIIKANTKIIPIKDGNAHFSKDIVLPLTPMVGVMGVSPKEGDIHCAVPGDHGANMDTKEIRIGSKVYLPVGVKGAGLAVGDLHACMGDGELSGTGIETSGKMCLKVTVLKGKSIKRPIIENEESIFTVASAKEFIEAIKIAVDDMVSLISKSLSLEFQDAYRLLSATCDIQISQVVNDLITVRLKAPKKLLNLTI